jgi:hypothetical protein
MEKFSHLVVSMVLRTRCKHCICLYTSPLLHSHTSIRSYFIFTRLIKPQVKDFWDFVGLLENVSTPNRHQA